MKRKISPTPLFHERKAIAKAGGGAVLYLPSEIVKRFGAEPGATIDFYVVDRGGKPFIEVPLPVGFGRDELLEFATERHWKIVRNNHPKDGEWSAALHFGSVRIRVDSWTRSGSKLLNNVFVEGPAFEVPKPGIYQKLFELARGGQVSIALHDPEGLWAKLTAANFVKETNPPSPLEVERFLSVVPQVAGRFVKRASSLECSLDQLGRYVDIVEACSKEASALTRVISS